MLPIKRKNFGDFLKFCEADLKSEKSQGPCRGFVKRGSAVQRTSHRAPLKAGTTDLQSSFLDGLDFGYDKTYDEKVRGSLPEGY